MDDKEVLPLDVKLYLINRKSWGIIYIVLCFSSLLLHFFLSFVRIKDSGDSHVIGSLFRLCLL